MPNEVILPRVDMDMATGKISKWLVAPGATVTKGQPLFEIETDKATMEIEAEASGTIRELAEAGSKDIPVGSVVAWIFGENEAQTAPTAGAPAASPPPPSETRSVPPATPPQAAASVQPPKVSPQPAQTAGSGDGLRATPLARRLAREKGIALDTLRGTGPRGRIQAADIVAPAQAAPAQARLAAKQPEAPQVVDLQEPHPDTVVREPVPADKAPAPARSPAVASASIPLGSTAKQLRKGTGDPIVLVHGFGSEANSWRPFLQTFTTTRPVLAAELPGHGGAPLGTVASFDDLVEAVGAAVAELGAVDVVAHSLGAAVMTAVAARGLADVRSLLLLSPAGLGPEINGGFVQGFLAATSEASLTPWMHELVADPQVISPPFVRATLKSREGTDRVAAQRRVASAVFPDGTQGFSVRADLDRLRVPTRVVYGTADRIIPARHGVGLPPLVALHVLPNIGHMPYLEARETVAAILNHAVSR